MCSTRARSAATSCRRPCGVDGQLRHGVPRADLQRPVLPAVLRRRSRAAANWAWNYVPQNVSKARIRGVEGQLGANLDGWQAGLSDPAAAEGRRRRCRCQQRQSVAAPPGAHRAHRHRPPLRRVRCRHHLVRRRQELRRCRQRARLGGYSTLALRASWQFTVDWQVEAKLANNAFDKEYETVYYYNQPGRTSGI